VLELALDRTPTLGAGHLICVDGPAGSGKTTLAEAIGEQCPESDVVHTDELLEGWSGLPGLHRSVEDLLRPLAAGRAGSWTRWDWHADRWAETHVVEPGALVVLEGTGSWAPGIADLVTVLVWVEAPTGIRLERGLARDGEAMRPQWEQWRIDEDALHARLGTRHQADVLVETSG
jgi:uridine kinase